jgi:ABC-2 type transport system ATP-binding protein
VTIPAIHVEHLRKTYVVPEREAGLRASIRSLVRRRSREVKAVDDINFQIAPGEMAGFLGPNGAGKTTTLKMLSGLLHPSGGTARVLDFAPERRDKQFLKQITLVMGQRNQLVWDIPALDSFELNRAIYRLPPDEFRRTRDEFIDLLDLSDLVRKPVRNLSLGERMKTEIAAALLHRPQVLFLDEPTIGLDVTMQKRIRQFIAEYNRRTGATVLLTSHYMADVTALCHRVIVILHGQLLFNGPLQTLVEQFAAYKTNRCHTGRRHGVAGSVRRRDQPRRQQSDAACAQSRHITHHGAHPSRRAAHRSVNRRPADRGRDRACVRAGAAKCGDSLTR